MSPRFLANLPLVLQMPKDRAAWEKAATEGTKLLTFRTTPQANKVATRFLPPSHCVCLLYFVTLEELCRCPRFHH